MAASSTSTGSEMDLPWTTRWPSALTCARARTLLKLVGQAAPGRLRRDMYCAHMQSPSALTCARARTLLKLVGQAAPGRLRRDVHCAHMQSPSALTSGAHPLHVDRQGRQPKPPRAGAVTALTR